MHIIDSSMSSDFPACFVPKSSLSKNVLDKILVSLGLLFAIPLMLVLASGIWVTLGRPLLFAQTRVGLGLREFTIRKFRTMHDTRDASGSLLSDEARQTAFTRIVRRLRLDELPQLVSVLLGDMALVGPRPLMLSTIQEFGELGRMRCSVVPGLTGWAQVNGNTHLTSRQKLALDLWYVNHQTVAFDFFILLLTVRTLVCGEKQDHRRLAIAEDYLDKLSAKIAVDLRRI
jgi:lipopolysaccharide/colanic/teichoic acid biosynthesis glycosyltransferase